MPNDKQNLLTLSFKKRPMFDELTDNDKAKVIAIVEMFNDLIEELTSYCYPNPELTIAIDNALKIALKSL